MASNGEAIIVNKRYSRKLIWDSTTRQVFAELSLEEYKNGNTPGTEFRWANLKENMKKRVGMDFTRDQLKYQLYVMRRDWELFDRLRNESGCGWDPVTKTINATPKWWDEKIKADPELAKFKDKNLEMYQLYYEPLFRDGVATGDKAKTSYPLLKNNIACDVEKDIETNKTEGKGDALYPLLNDKIACDVENDIGTTKIEGKGDTDEVSVGDATKNHFLESSSTKRKWAQFQYDQNCSTKRKSVRTSSAELKLDMVLQESSSQSTQCFPSSRKVLSIRECMEIVANFPGFEPSSVNYNKAIKIFFSEEAREGFMIPPTTKDKMSFLYSLF